MVAPLAGRSGLPGTGNRESEIVNCESEIVNLPSYRDCCVSQFTFTVHSFRFTVSDSLFTVYCYRLPVTGSRSELTTKLRASQLS
jgi:hypothetical protein